MSNTDTNAAKDLASAHAVIEQCRNALAEELAAWDIKPPLHHVGQRDPASAGPLE